MTLVGVEAAPVLAAIHVAALDVPWSEAAFRQLLSSAGVFALVAEDREAPVAFVLARTVADEGEILTLATLPAERRKGFAWKLMEATARHAEQRGVRRLLLEVAEDNDAALALYGRLGYQVIGKRAAYYTRNGAAQDARVLCCDLSGA